jgi:hypothetical protein
MKSSTPLPSRVSSQPNGRIEASKCIAAEFCLAGYTGIRTDNYGETVIFDLTAILRVETLLAKNTQADHRHR